MPNERIVHLLTMWCERPAQGDRPALWRFSLVDTRTHRRYGFVTLEALMAFLREQMAARERGEKEE